MKRVQSICGKTIFEARTIRDFNTYDCPIGSYNIYVSAEVRNLGIAFKIVDFRCITSWETQWGWTGVFKLVDESGREFTWKTSKWLDEHAVGKVCRGTIKELKEFRGVKQTELTRCRVG